ncbi:MAG: hypothetical protein U1F43_24660 [Myxococcota bacterium]
MSAFDTFQIEAGGPGAGLLVPGRVLRALALGAGVPAEDVGQMEPDRRGAVSVEIARHRAVGIATPRHLASHEGGKPALFVLRRVDDEPELDEARSLLVTWSDGGTAPAPGAVATALVEAAGGGLFAEDLGFGLAGASFLQVQVPLSLVLRGVPATIRIGARELQVELAEKKKP